MPRKDLTLMEARTLKKQLIDSKAHRKVRIRQRGSTYGVTEGGSWKRRKLFEVVADN